SRRRHTRWPRDWSSDVCSSDLYNHDPRGTRFNDREQALGPATARSLVIEWVFPTPNAVSGTPIVVGDSIIAGDFDGNVYSLRGEIGRASCRERVWSSEVSGAL